MNGQQKTILEILSDLLKNPQVFHILLLLIGGLFILVAALGGIPIGNNQALPSMFLEMRYILTGIGSVLIILAIFLFWTSRNISSAKVDSRSLSAANATISNEIREETLLQNLDLSKVKKIIVLGHTGNRIYQALHPKLEPLLHTEHLPVEIKILIRTPFVEGLYRNRYINTTITRIKALRLDGCNIDVRFYESVPAYRGIICELDKNERICYLGSYYWKSPNISKSFDYGTIIRDYQNVPNPQVQLLETWINQYWGRDEIHTVVFDFDDTLVDTMNAQVRAWVEVLETFLARKTIRRKNLSEKLRDFVDDQGYIINKDDLSKTVETIFIDKQLAEAIVQDLFVELSNDLLLQINNERFNIRKRMMTTKIKNEGVKLYNGVEKTLDELSRRYNFAIISSTDEEMISEYLREKGLKDYFPIVLGKRDPSLRNERENIYNKTLLLIKLSEIIGIPLNRLVYIGDNNSDYLATRQIGISFIEARQAAKLIGEKSLIKDLDPQKTPIGEFDSFEDNKLVTLLNNHSSKITKNKYDT